MSMECIFALYSAVNEGVRDHLVRPFTWGNGMLISPSKDEAAVNGCQIPMIWLCTGSIGTGHTAELVVCAYLLNYLVLFKTISWNCLGVWSGFGI